MVPRNTDITEFNLVAISSPNLYGPALYTRNHYVHYLFLIFFLLYILEQQIGPCWSLNAY